MPTVYPRGHIIERFPIWPEGQGKGPQWLGLLIQGGDRPTHRIIKVLDADGTPLSSFSGYDQANAVNELDWWLASVSPPPEALRVRFEAGEQFRDDCLEGGYWKHWLAKQPKCDICGGPIGDGQRNADTHACTDCIRRTIAAVEAPLTAHEQFIDAIETPHTDSAAE
jgi:hypothetical protein